MTTTFITGFPGPAGVLDNTFRQFPVWTSDAVAALASTAYGKGYLLRVTFPSVAPAVHVAASYGRSTTPTDTPANTYVPGYFAENPNYGVALFSGIEPDNVGRGGFGVITLPDVSGDLDARITDAWDGATVEILRGNPGSDFNTYGVVATVTSAGILYSQWKKEVRLRDLGWKLDAAPLHDQIFTGAGGINGDAALAGQDKPYCIGVVFNVSPVLINATTLIYQVSCSSIRSVLDLRDGGVSLGSGPDYPNYAALAAASVSPSTYATCKALGLIRLGSSPVYTLTGDFEGDNDLLNGQFYPSTRGQIALRIATGLGTQKLSITQVDYSGLNTLEQDQPATCGFYWPTQPTKAQALKEVMQGCLGYFAMRLNGTLALGSVKAPTGTAAVSVNYPEDFVSEPALQTYQAPRQATYIGYGRNYTKMTPNQIAGSVAQTPQAAIWQQETRWGSSTNPGLAATFVTAPTIRVAGGFAYAADANAEAARQQTLMQTRRERFQLTLNLDPFADLLGKIIQVNNYPRLGWGSSRKFLVVGMSFASGIGVTYDLWG